VLQQGYSVSQVAEELGLKASTATGYVLKALSSGHAYVWGPQLEIPHSLVQEVVDVLATQDMPSAEAVAYRLSGGTSISTTSSSDDGSSSTPSLMQVTLILAHLKQSVESVPEAQLTSVIGVENVAVWRVRKIRLFAQPVKLFRGGPQVPAQG